MSRSKWKGPFLDSCLLKKTPITKIWSRCSTIPSSFIGKSIFIHTGNTFKRIFISREKVGYKFGDFCFTRTYKKKIFKKKKKTI